MRTSPLYRWWLNLRRALARAALRSRRGRRNVLVRRLATLDRPRG